MIRCGLCGGGTRLLWESLNMRECRSCGLMFKHPLPGTAALDELYERSWAKPGVYIAETGSTNTRLADIYAGRLASELRVDDFRGAKILDFGAGKGEVQVSLRSLGADVYAIEPYGYDYLHKQELKVFRSLKELPANLAFDGIVMFEVLEHLEHPWDQLIRLREKLTDNGWVCVTTPNSHGLNARVFGDNWREAVKDGHINLFCPRACQTMWEICGFSVCKRLRWFYRVDNSLRCYFKLALRVFRLDGGLRYLVWK